MAPLGGRAAEGARVTEEGELSADFERLPEPELAITTARVDNGKAKIEGTIASEANAELTILVTGKPATGPPVRSSRTITTAAGRFRAQFRVPADLSTAPDTSVRVEYPGDDTYAPQAVTSKLGA